MDLIIWEDDGDDIMQDAYHVFQAVHGPYDPAVFYGKKDLPLREVISIGKILKMKPWESLPSQ